MIFYHEWLGTTEDYDKLVEEIGIDKVKPVPSLDWKVKFVKVLDSHKNKWVTVQPGEYIMENAGEVWVEHGR